MTTFVALGLLLVALCLVFLWPRRSTITGRSQDDSSKSHPIKYNPANGFNWETTEPLQFRPFKPKYHLTMALENLDPNDLIVFDNTYKERLDIRERLLNQHRDKVIGVTNDADARIRDAVRELYHSIMAEYLPKRYPTIFQTQDSSVQNLVTGQSWPTSLSDSSPTKLALEILPKNVDEDFFILLPHHQHDAKQPISEMEIHDENEIYVLEAYSAFFPSGFEPENKLGKRLTSIHDPVPGYKEKLEKSMDRFFRKLPAGKCVKRLNWAVTVDEELYSNFDKSGVALSEPVTQLSVKDLDLNKSFLRCERQTLHRLPQSRAIVFAFKTYLYTLQQVKAEGLGEEMATAIDGLRLGSNPGIYLYKSGPKWGEAVKEYLRR